MLPCAEDSGPRWQILFLSGRSFEIEEILVDLIGCRSLLIVERGQGLRWAVVLIGFEVCWIVSKLRVALQAPGKLNFLGRLSGARRSLAAWVRGEVGEGSSV